MLEILAQAYLFAEKGRSVELWASNALAAAGIWRLKARPDKRRLVSRLLAGDVEVLLPAMAALVGNLDTQAS